MGFRTLVIGTAATAALVLAGTASADDHRRGHNSRGWDSGHYSGSYNSHRGHRGRSYHRRHHNNNDDTAALLIGGAILGLVVGAALSNKSSSSAPSYSYSAPPPPSYGYQSQPSYGYAPQAAPAYSNASQGCGGGGGRIVSGALVGGLVGGLLGSGVSGHGAREEGTAVGAVLGSAIGGAIASDRSKCNTSGYAQNAGGYYQTSGYTYEQPAAAPAYEPPYSYEQELYGGPGTTPSTYSGPAAEECERSWRVTTLPDGTEMREPVDVCREANYGGWTVRE